ncbi:MAG: hypothetical protein KIT73_03900 [Burkholderiales bacterium]|nr:hypothetical protein [Burkholderiales bacterium]
MTPYAGVFASARCGRGAGRCNDTQAYVLGNVIATSYVTITAEHLLADAVASAKGVETKGTIEVGYSTATADVTSNVLAYIDQGRVYSTFGDIRLLATEGDDRDGNPVSTGPSASATASQGVYASGDEENSQTHVNQNTTVKAFVGNPDTTRTSTADVRAAGEVSLTAGSWTEANSEALIGSNAAFVASSDARAYITATKVTHVATR